MGKSDKQRIKDILWSGDWVCGSTIMRELFIKDYAQRISDLRKESLNIEGEPCNLQGHNHRQYMYKLNRYPNIEVDVKKEKEDLCWF